MKIAFAPKTENLFAPENCFISLSTSRHNVTLLPVHVPFLDVSQFKAICCLVDHNDIHIFWFRWIFIAALAALHIVIYLLLAQFSATFLLFPSLTLFYIHPFHLVFNCYFCSFSTICCCCFVLCHLLSLFCSHLCHLHFWICRHFFFNALCVRLASFNSFSLSFSVRECVCVSLSLCWMLVKNVVFSMWGGESNWKHMENYKIWSPNTLKKKKNFLPHSIGCFHKCVRWNGVWTPKIIQRQINKSQNWQLFFLHCFKWCLMKIY